MKKIIRITITLSLILVLVESLSVNLTSAQDLPGDLVGSTERSSISSEGIQGNKGSSQDYYPYYVLGIALSADGRYVAFDSSSSNLVAADTNAFSDVFVHDRVTGETSRVSVAGDGSQGDGDSYLGSISADGRYVTFWSSATNLVDGDTMLCNWRYYIYNCSDAFVHDRVSGETTIISVASDGIHGNWNSTSNSISADGRYVVFSSDADNLVVGDTNQCDLTMTSFGCSDVFVHDRVTALTTRVSVSSEGTQGTQASWGGSISADGRYVAFTSRADFSADDMNAWQDIYLHDRDSGETIRVSVASDGSQAEKGGESPSISADAGFIAFSSISPDLVDGDSNVSRDVFVYDRVTHETERVSVASDGTQGDDDSGGPRLSADGRFVAFGSSATNLVVGDANNYCDTDYDEVYDDNCGDVFLYDRVTGETSLVSLAWDGLQGNSGSDVPSISGDGRYVAFGSVASNLVEGDTNIHCDLNFDMIFDENCPDIFVRDREGSNLGYPISGHITNLEGNPLPGVIISTSYGITATTDIQGDYTLPLLPSGTYWLTASLDEFTFIPFHHETSVPPQRVGVNFSQGFLAILPLINR